MAPPETVVEPCALKGGFGAACGGGQGDGLPAKVGAVAGKAAFGARDTGGVARAVRRGTVKDQRGLAVVQPDQRL